MSRSTVVKKVKAYPFPIAIKIESKGAAVTLQGQVTKLVQTGLLVQVAGTSLQPGDHLELSFETPVLHGAVSSSAVVVKVMNQLKGVALLELHFRGLSSEGQSRIANFLVQTGQARGQ